MKMTLQLADRLIHHPREIIKDILVKVDKFIFPLDFVIQDLDEKVEVPLILGRQFLVTSQALIDVKDGRMVLRFGEEKVVFKLEEAMRHSMEFDDLYYFVDHIDDCVSDFAQDSLLKDEMGDMLEEEPPQEIDQKEEQKEGIDRPSPKKKWWKRVESKKKKRLPSPKTNSTHTSLTSFGELEFIALLSTNVVGRIPSAMGGERLHFV